MTLDEIASTMAMKAPIKSSEEWLDFFSMGPELQEAEARLVKSTVLAQPDGQSAWDGVMVFLGVAATVAGDVVGVGSAVTFFRGLA